MKNWRSFIQDETLDWLLQESNPSVRYFTLQDLLENRHNDSEVIGTRENIMITRREEDAKQ